MDNAIYGLIGTIFGALLSFFATKYIANKSYQSEIMRIEKENNESIRHYEIKIKTLEHEKVKLKQSFDNEKDLMKEKHSYELQKAELEMKNNLTFSFIQSYLNNEDGNKMIEKLHELEKQANLMKAGKFQGHKK